MLKYNHMFTIKTYVAKSKIDNLGVFAGEDIKAGQIVWHFEPGLDRRIPINKLKKLPKNYQDFIKKCGFTPKGSKYYFISLDYDIFSNHSDNPNLSEEKPKKNKGCPDVIASRNIKAGEELTQDYFKLDKASDARYKLSHFQDQ